MRGAPGKSPGDGPEEPRSAGAPSAAPASAASSRAAATTRGASRRPGELPSRLAGPETHSAPSSAPSRSTGALTLATPGSRSAMLDAQPRRRTAASSSGPAAGNRLASSDQASSTFPPDPASSIAEREPGVASVSAPVLRDGALLGALCVSGPVSRLGNSPGRRLAPLVVAAARELAALAGDGAPAPATPQEQGLVPEN